MQSNANALPRAAIWADLVHQAATIDSSIYRVRALASLIPAAQHVLLPCHKPIDDLARCVRAARGTAPFALLEWLGDELERRAHTGGHALRALAGTAAALCQRGPADVNLIVALLASGALDRQRAHGSGSLGSAFGARARAIAESGAVPLPGPASADVMRVSDAFVADLSVSGSEANFASSLALVAGCARAAVAHARPALEERMRACLPALSARARERTRPHFAVAAYALRGLEHGLASARTIRAQGLRRAALSLLVRAALARRAHCDAWAFVEAMAPSLWRQRAHLLIADAMADRGLTARTERALAVVTHPRLAGYRTAVAARAALLDVHGNTPPLIVWDEQLALPDELLHAASVPELPWTVASERAVLMATAIARQVAAVGDDHRERERLARWLSQLPGLSEALRNPRAAGRVVRALAACANVPGRVPGDAPGFVRELYHPPERWQRDFLLSIAISARAEWLCNTASAHADDRERAMADGMIGASPPAARAAEFRDAHSAYRTYYDEGVALSPRAAERRKVLWRASRYCLRRALRESSGERALLQARLRIIVSLGVSLGVSLSVTQGVTQGGRQGRPGIARDLGRLLADEPCHQPVYGDALLALAQLDGRAAARIALTRLVELRAGGQNIDALLSALEHRGALPRGFAREFTALLDSLRARLPGPAAMAWLGEVIAEGQRTGAAIADLWFLRGVRAQLLRSTERSTALPGGRDVLTDARRELAQIGECPPVELLAALTENHGHLHLLRWLAPPSLPERGRVWTAEGWRALMALAADRRVGAVHRGMVRTLARQLAARASAHASGRLHTPVPRSRAVEQALLDGAFPIPGGAERIPLGLESAASGPRYRLRFLDKRRDLLTYLRFADAAPCCFSSTSNYYQCRCHNHRRWVVALWKDPLSFCFHIERVHGAPGQAHGAGASAGASAGAFAGAFERPPTRNVHPVGFVFGGFGLVGRARRARRATPTLLVNGVYLRRQQAHLRAAVLAAIERTLCVPLGIPLLGVGNAHAGRGALPGGYVRRSVQLTRLRALTCKGQPVTEIYDDISTVVNVPVHVHGLWWKTVRDDSLTDGYAGALASREPEPLALVA